jgi:hypothetical protein
MARRETWWASCSLAIASIVGVGAAFAQPAAPAKPVAPAAQPPAAASSAAPAADTASPAPGTAPAKPKPDPATVLPPRPPTLAYDPPPVVPWERHLEVGPDLAFVTQPASHDYHGMPTRVHYASTFGFAAHVTWQMLKYLQFSVYFVDSNHGLRFDPGALGLPGQISTPNSAHTYSLGGRFQPLFPFTERIRGWLSGGIGWARWDFPRMEVTEHGATNCALNTYVVPKPPERRGCYMLYERNNNMAVFPLGLGASFDLVPHHLALVVEFTAAIPAFQSGTAVSSTRAVNDAGANVPVGGLPVIDVMLVESLGLSLVL